MRTLLTGFFTLAVLLGASELRAGAQADCDAPFAFGGPVQVFVLPYAFEPDPQAREVNQRLVETARRLSYLLQRDILSNDSFGSLAVILLHENRPGACRVAEVQERLLSWGALSPGQAVALIWGRIYREDDDVFVQSYLRFLRVDPGERRYVDERFTVVLHRPAQRLEGGLPTQSVAFSPQALLASDLDRIDADWRASARLYDEPRDDAASDPLPPPEVPLAYQVHEVRPDGWLGVELQTGERGWLRADREVKSALRKLLPELHYLEAVIGYLSYRQATDDRGFPRPPAPWMIARIEDRFARFAESSGEGGDQTSVLARTLVGALQAFATEDAIETGLDALRQALAERPEEGSLRNLVAMAELRQCCAEHGTGPALQQVPRMLLSGLAVDPNNAELLNNLQATYAWLLGEPEGTGRALDGGPLATAKVRVNANLRAGPSTASEKVGLATGGSELTITGTDAAGDWLRVARDDAPDAYIAAFLLEDMRPVRGAESRLECAETAGRLTCTAQPMAEPTAPAATPGPQDGPYAERLAATGVSAREASARLQEVKELRQALGYAE